jgi:hypothetical protein
MSANPIQPTIPQPFYFPSGITVEMDSDYHCPSCKDRLTVRFNRIEPLSTGSSWIYSFQGDHICTGCNVSYEPLPNGRVRRVVNEL